ERPGLQCPRERFLNNVFREVEMFDAEDSGENGNHLRPLMAKKMFHYAGYFRRLLDNFFQSKATTQLVSQNYSCSPATSFRAERGTSQSKVASREVSPNTCHVECVAAFI